MYAYIHHRLTLNQFSKSGVNIIKCSILVQRTIMATTSLATKMISNCGSIKICLLSELC